MSNQRVRSIVAIGALAAPIAMTFGCNSPESRSIETGRALTLNDFVRVDAGSVGPDINTSIHEDDESLNGDTETTNDGDVPPTLVPAAPNGLSASSPAAVREPLPGELVVIDSLVGEVNGRPIYAEQFFAPLDAFLRNRAQALTPPQFEQQLTLVIEDQLKVVIRNELFLAQARAALTPEQEQGLFHWMGQIQEQLVSQGGGTRSSADARLLESEGQGLDRKVEEIRDIALLRRLFEEKIRPRVIVSWRDIEREYERNFDRYHSPARVTLARITLLNDVEAAQIEDVKRRLAGGESFQSVAESLGKWENGKWQTYELGPKGLAGIALQAAFVDALAGLDRGDTTAPIVTERATWWLHITEFHEPTSRSIYDPEVQFELRNAIRSALQEREQERYLDSLIDDSIMDDLTEMRDRLMVIARRRYRP